VDPDVLLYLAVALQALFAAAVGAACIAAYRWTRCRSVPIAIVLALGVLVRAWLGLGLFVVSYFDLPILASLHTGDGFWLVAPDARVYHQLAALAAAGAAVPPDAPSPSFLEVLGLWMWAAGDSPASAVLFNLAVHVTMCVVLVAAFNPLRSRTEERAALIAASTFSFSPVLILLGTQTLKDVFSAFLVVVVTVSASGLFATTPNVLTRCRSAVLVLGMAGAVYLMAGIRAYYALFIVVAVALALVVRLCMTPRQVWRTWIPIAGALLTILWIAFMFGAGPYYYYYGDAVTRMTGVRVPGSSVRSPQTSVQQPSPQGSRASFALRQLDGFRQGFARSGGDTNLARRDSQTSPAEALVIGTLATFIPMSILMKLSVVDFSGGTAGSR
jgi:hypothetical protein